MAQPPVEETVMYALVKSAKAYLRRSGARLAGVGLHPGQDLLLRQLWETDGLSQSELIERLGVEPPTVAKALARLEKGGLIARERDARDARVSRVYLTPRGRESEDAVRAIWAELEAQATEGFTAEERSLLRRLALAVAGNLA